MPEKMGMARRTAALSRYLAALNDGENGVNNVDVEDNNNCSGVAGKNQGEQLRVVVDESFSGSAAGCVEGGNECSDGEEESGEEGMQGGDHVDRQHIHQSQGTATSNYNRRTPSRFHNNIHQQQPSSSSPRSKGDRETFIVDSSTLLKRSKVWGAAASSVQKTGKYHRRRPSTDKQSPCNDGDIVDDNSASDDIVLDNGVPATVSGDYDHVTIASEMSGLTPASHLHTPTAPHLLPPPLQLQQRQQQHDHPSQPDLAAGGSTPLAASGNNTYQADNHTPLSHINSSGKQHRNSRHHWPPTPPKTQHPQLSHSSSQTPPQIMTTSSTPPRLSTSNQEINPNANWRERRSKRGDFFSRPHHLQSANSGTPTKHGNQEPGATPPRWKQKGAMLTIDTGTSKYNNNDRRAKTKPPQQPVSTSQQQQQLLPSASNIQQIHNHTNNDQLQTPESHDSPLLSCSCSESTDASPHLSAIADSDMEHHSNNSDKENNNKPTRTIADGNRSPVHQRITAWNQVGNQLNQETLPCQKQQRKQLVHRKNSLQQNNTDNEKNASTDSADHHELGEDHCEKQNRTIHASQSTRTTPGNTDIPSHHRQRRYNGVHHPSPNEQKKHLVSSAREDKDFHMDYNTDGDTTPSSHPPEASPEPPSAVAAAAAEVAAELVRRGGKSPKAAAAFLAAIQSSATNDNGDRGNSDNAIDERSQRSKQLRKQEFRKRQQSQLTDKNPGQEVEKQEGQYSRVGTADQAQSKTAETTTTYHGTLSYQITSQQRERSKIKQSIMPPTNSTGEEATTENAFNSHNISNGLSMDKQIPAITEHISSSQHTSDTAIVVAADVHNDSSTSNSLEVQVQANLHEMEVRMEARMLRLEARLEAQLKARLEYMEAKMDARMDEIQSILKLMVTASTDVVGGSSRGGGSLDEDYEV